MKTLADTLVPDNLYTEAKAHAAGGGIPLLAILGQHSTCLNCGGAKQIGLYLLSGTGYRYPGMNPPRHFHEGLWHNAQLRTYPCPICNEGESGNAISLRLEMSGLQPDEYQFRPAFVEEMTGKTEAAHAVQSLMADTARPVGWLFLHGDNGMGKSGLLKSAVAMGCYLGLPCYYTTADAILNQVYDVITRSKRDDDESETMQELVQRYDRYQILAVDELGNDRVADTQFALSKLFTVLDNRYNRRTEVCTLLASNMSPQQLKRDSRWRYFESRTQDGLRIGMGGETLRGK